MIIRSKLEEVGFHGRGAAPRGRRHLGALRQGRGADADSPTPVTSRSSAQIATVNFDLRVSHAGSANHPLRDTWTHRTDGLTSDLLLETWGLLLIKKGAPEGAP